MAKGVFNVVSGGPLAGVVPGFFIAGLFNNSSQGLLPLRGQGFSSPAALDGGRDRGIEPKGQGQWGALSMLTVAIDR